MVDDKQLFKALEWLAENAGPAAQARAERLWLEEFMPAMRAKIAAECIEAGDSAAAADTKAKASQAYHDVLKGYREAVERDEKYRWQRSRADALLSAYQTLSANSRSIGKTLGG